MTFLSSNGLTETSASHLCAVASQKLAEAEAILTNTTFVNSTMAIVGSESQLPTEKGYTSLDAINEALKQCMKLNSFIAWFAEARKHLENERTKLSQLTYPTWWESLGNELPTKPTKPVAPKNLTLSDIIDKLDTKTRQQYLALEAIASVYGKFIHPDYPLDKARKTLHNAIRKPHSTSGNGRDTIIYSYSPSMDPKKVDEYFESLQTAYRQTEQSLNHMKADLRKQLYEANLQLQKEYDQALESYRRKLDDYDAEIDKIVSLFDKHQLDEREKLSKLRLVLPDKLKETYEYLNSLGK